jgi:hypothetical protein
MFKNAQVCYRLTVRECNEGIQKAMKKQQARYMILGGVIGGVVVGIIAIVLAFILTKPPTDVATQSASQNLSGKIICAPKKADSAATTECAYGLQTDDGKKYLLYAARFPNGVSIQHYSNGTSVIATGTVSSSDTDRQLYDVDGSIMATSVRAK